jgi:hypothetical protein
MRHILAARLLLDAMKLLADDVKTLEQAQEVRAVLFDTPEGDLALASLESAIGLEFVPVEYRAVAHYWEFGPLSIEVAREGESQVAPALAR